MPKYKRVTLEDRSQIRALLNLSQSYSEISETLGFHKSTISREVRRNRLNGLYQPKQAHRMYLHRRVSCHRPAAIQGQTKGLVEGSLRRKWSPEQVSGRLRVEKGIRISHETIYRYIRKERRAGGELWKCLRRKKNRGMTRYAFKKRKKNELNISERPKAANSRERIGDWERDLMLTKDRRAVLVCVDRKSRFCKITPLDTFRSYSVYKETMKTLSLTGAPIHTITNDNGTEFSDSLFFKEIPVYYCDPYKPSQRGSVENLIGLLRQFISRQEDIQFWTTEHFRKIEERMNYRPRKCLDYECPAEVFYNRRVALVS